MISLLRLHRASCVLILLLSVPLLAQKGGGSGGGGTGGGGKGGGPVSSPGPVSGVPNYGSSVGYGSAANPMGLCTAAWSCPISTPRPMPGTPTRDDPTCFLAPVAGIHSPTVSVTRLEVPHTASKEYEDACSAIQHKKLSRAEEHLQNAIKLYPDYTAAWVLLGQVQEQQHKKEQAVQSCNRAQEIDASYAPSYLCLAFLASADQKWDQLRELTNHLLQLHPINASNAFYYNALANYNLNKLSAAEVSALRGVADTKERHQPQLHLLLAKIYEREGDRSLEIAELHEYLKRDPHAENSAEVSTLLKKIDPEHHQP